MKTYKVIEVINKQVTKEEYVKYLQERIDYKQQEIEKIKISSSKRVDKIQKEIDKITLEQHDVIAGRK